MARLTVQRSVERACMGIAMVAIVAGCRHGAAPEEPSPPAPAPAPTPEAEPPEEEAAFVPGAPWAGPLVTGGKTLVRLDDHGHPVETLSPREAIRPRWLVPEQSLLFLRQQGKQWQLVRIELPSLAETVVVTDLVGNATDCPGEPPAPPPPDDPDADDEDLLDWLEVQDDGDFRVGGGLACVSFMDRNMNMADVRVQVRVRLDDHTVERRLELALHCSDGDDDDDFADGFPECDGDRVGFTVRAPAEPDLDQPGAIEPYRVEEGRVLHRVGDHDDVVAGPFPCIDDDGKPTTRGCPWGLPTFVPASSSPSGRWVVLAGNESEGDYMHQQWLLLDVHRGELFAIADDATTWPAPLTPAQLSALSYEVVSNDMVGESTMLWLAGDRLVIDTRLVVPGESVVALPGFLAR